MPQRIPEEVQKEWIKETIDGTIDYRKVVRQLSQEYGWDSETINGTRPYEIYSSDFARRTSYLTVVVLHHHHKLSDSLKAVVEDARGYYWSRLNEIQRAREGIAKKHLYDMLEDYVAGSSEIYPDPISTFNEVIKGTREFFLECLAGYAPEVGGLLKAFFYYALRSEPNFRLDKLRKRMLTGYANQILRVLNLRPTFEVPDCGSFRFLQKIKILMNTLKSSGISTELFKSPFAMFPNDEEYLEEVLKNKYYYLWPQALGSEPPSGTHIRDLISLDEKTLSILSLIKGYSPKSVPEVQKAILEIMLGYPVDTPNFFAIVGLQVYQDQYSKNFRGLPLLLLWSYLTPFHTLPFSLPPWYASTQEGYEEFFEGELESQPKEFLEMYRGWVPENLNSLILRINLPSDAEEREYRSFTIDIF